MSRNMYLILGIVALFSTVVWLGSGIGNAQSETPLPPPAMTATAMAPTPMTEPPLSPESEKALQHISEREGIAVADLLVVNEHPVTYPLLGRSFQLVTILDIRTEEGQEYALLVDLTDGTIEEDIEALKEAEQAAKIEKYGKLHPALYERLPEAGEDERLPVAIWPTAGPETKTRSDIFNILIAQYPQAAQAIEKWGEPWAVDDPELSREIHEAYYQLRDESVSQRVAPLATELRDRYSIDVTTYPGMPSVSATLTKQLIESIAARPDVASLYLIEEQVTQTMDTAAWADRAPAVWRAGYHGSGQLIAIIDLNAISDQVSCLDVASTVNPSLPFDQHPTHVASVASCNSTQYPGIAPGAQLVDAGFAASGNQQENAVQALEQALVNHNADTAVASITFGYDLTVDWIDRAFDYWAREEDVLIAVPIGNEEVNPDLYPGSPAAGWNVLTVGGSDHRQTAYWADDDFAEGGGDIDSAYKNPSSDQGDREKPEVVAPSWDITVHGINKFGNPAIISTSGTSVAAPQVAGLAALLLERNGGLAYSAPALRSIIMASALHNIDGATGIPTGQELKDGAGAIDAALADQVAQTQGANGGTCNVPCWWNVPTSNLSPPVGGSLNNYFRASRGERIRVAINWWSNADGTPPSKQHDTWQGVDENALVGADAAYASFQSGSSGAAVVNRGESTSVIVEHVKGTAGMTNYTAITSLGSDWMSTGTTLHFPAVKYSYYGRTGRLHIFNPDSTSVTITPRFRQADNGGAEITCSNISIPAGGRVVYHPASCSGTASARYYGVRLSANAPIAAIITEDDDATRTYAATSNAFNAGSTIVYVPMAKSNYGGNNSGIAVQNVGSSSANVTVTFYDTDSSSIWQASYNNLAAHSTHAFYLPSILPTGQLVSARITSSGPPIAATVYEAKSGTQWFMQYNAFLGGSKAVVMPYVYKEARGAQWNSGIQAQNVGSASTTITLQYYSTNGTLVASEAQTCDSYESVNFYAPTNPSLPLGFIGSAVITADQPIVAESNIAKSPSSSEDGAMSYSGVNR